MSELRDRLQNIFRQVFGDPDIVLRDDMTADHVDGWDSLAHVDLMVAIEKGFGIKFATAEMSKMKEPGQNVGTLIQLIERKVNKKQG
jgi:acyl carrier protein